MIQIQINKDVGSFEPKIIGPFTTRHIICIAIAAPFALLIYNLAAAFLPRSTAAYFLIVPAGIAWAFGWPKPYGMRTEQFLRSVFVNMFLAPPKRVYRTVNTHEKALAVLERYAREQAEREAIENGGKKAKQSAPKKPKYKVSPEAVK